MINVSLENAEVLFTTRAGGTSVGGFSSLNLGSFVGDDPLAVSANLEIVRELAGVGRLEIVRQVHGNEIFEPPSGAPAQPPDADGLLTSRRLLGLVVTGADCPPLVLATRDHVAVLHCGWRSIAAGIVERGIEALGEASIQAAIGPGVSAEHYAVGCEVVTAIGADAEPAYRDGHLSLREILRLKLARAGVDLAADVDRCTYAEPAEFFSYRRDGAACGRQAAVAWRR
ncbi:MAG: polyphenol oxidase family protein [Solirubrobacterales bacterium]